MSKNNLLKRFFSLRTLKKSILALLILFLSSILIIPFSLYQPLRYLKIAHPDEIVLKKNPSYTFRFVIIEAPNLKLEKYEEFLHRDLPPIYINLPNDLSECVVDYLEKRNTYIRQLYELDYHTNIIETTDFYPEEISMDSFEIMEVIPYQQNGNDCFFVIKSKNFRRASLTFFDSSLNKIDEFSFSKIFRNVVSAKFPDRFWILTAMIAATGSDYYYNRITYNGEINYTYKYVGRNENLAIDPLRTMKVINKDTNPEIAVHIDSPKELNTFMDIFLVGFFYIGIISLPLLLMLLLIKLIIWIVKKNKKKEKIE